MAGRDQEFADFVDARGPALWAMATLLEPDADRAEALLVAALADVRRRWSSIERDDAVEDAAREAIAARCADGHRRDGTWDAVSHADGDLVVVSAARAALLTLTARRRVLLVASTFGAVDEHELARMCHVPRGQVTREVSEAEAELRQHLPELLATRPLLSVLDTAVLRDVPDGLTATVLAARPRRPARLVVSSAVLGVAVAVVLATTALGDGQDAADTQPPPWATGELLSSEPLTQVATLQDSPIEAASGALVVNDVPVVVDAATGQWRSVLDASAALAPKPSDRGAHGVIRQNWTQVVLSPDGQTLLLVRARPLVVSVPFGQARPSTGGLLLVDISSGKVTPIDEMNPVEEATGTAGIAQPRLAWSPDSKAFACACSGTLSIGLMDGSRLGTVNHTARKAKAVVWGVDGLTVADAKGGWSYVDRPAADTAPFVYSAGLAITSDQPTMYLEVSAITLDALGADTKPDGGHCTLWDAQFSYPRSVLSVAERGGTLCTPMTVQAGRNGFLLVLPGAGSDADQRPFDVVEVNRQGSSKVITSVPREATAASFASELVG
jgi:DNA-directed RNA polymerase specialized sigma24 family protein